MKRFVTVLGLVTTLCLPLGASAQGTAAGAKTPPKISAQLRNVPFKAAIDTLFQSTGYQYDVEQSVTNAPISLMLQNTEFDEALRLLIRAAGEVQPEVYVQKQNGRYLIGVQAKSSKVETVLEKIAIQFQNVDELVHQLNKLPIPADLESMQAIPTDNSLLVQATPKALEELKRLIRLLDLPTRSLSIRVGVTGPGTNGQAFHLASIARTLTGKEVVIDEETTSDRQLARLKVRVKPLLQGDGQVMTDSDWDLSVPVAGGAKGSIRLVKRLTTTARLQPGRGITVGEVDLTPYGGSGTVRLWLRADVIREGQTVPTTTNDGEPISGVRVFNGKPYFSAFWLADDLHGQLRRRDDGQYEIRRGSSSNSGQLENGERPSRSGPFRLTRGVLAISDQLQFVATLTDESRLIPDAEGEPLVPLEDLARTLGGRVQYDSAADSYRIVGGSRLSSLRFSGEDAKGR